MPPESPSTPAEPSPASIDAVGTDPRFSFDFVAYDDLADGQRWSTWTDVEALCRGPEPRPDWVVTSQGAIDTDLGILKTGKEADVFLLERADPHLDPGVPGSAVVLAAKRYRTPEHRSFHRSSAYTDGRSVKRSRDERALKRKSTFGRQVAAGEWAVAEWDALVRCRELGLAVPYPVQIDGTELLLEWVTVPDPEEPLGVRTAPRLAQTRPDVDQLAAYADEVRSFLRTLVGAGLVHGDLSPYNILAGGDGLVVIDLPQVVDLAGNPAGFDYLLRDCENLSSWFTRRGLALDAQELFADLLAHAL